MPCKKVRAEQRRTVETYRSGDTCWNSFWLSGFTWERNEAVSTNWPTVLENLIQ